MTSGLDRLLADLEAESEALHAIVGAAGVDFSTPTPAPGWTIGHQLGHLAWTEEIATMAVQRPEEFAATARAFSEPGSSLVDAMAGELAALPHDVLLNRWHGAGVQLVDALRRVPSGTRIAWLGPPMGAGTMASARIMETWAHGLDIADALEVRPEPTDRLRNVADLGIRTRDFAFVQRGETPPSEPFRFELVAPSGVEWSWGPEDARQRISGPALDFCLLVTRRRHPADLRLVVEGPDAGHWTTIAQVFAGPPGPDRAPGI